MCQYSSQFQGNALYLIDYLRSELQHQCPTALCPEQEHLSPAVPSPQVNLQAAWDRCVHRHICWKSELSSGWQPGGILIKLIIGGALPLPHLPLITLPFYPTHPIEDFSLLFFFVDHAKNSVHLFSLCCRWWAQRTLLFTDPRHLPITFCLQVQQFIQVFPTLLPFPAGTSAMGLPCRDVHYLFLPERCLFSTLLLLSLPG